MGARAAILKSNSVSFMENHISDFRGDLEEVSFQKWPCSDLQYRCNIRHFEIIFRQFQGKPFFILIFSSPEHEVLWVSYCDWSWSVCSSGRPAARPSFCLSVRPLTVSLKIFTSKTRRPILIKLGRNVPWMKLYKNC